MTSSGGGSGEERLKKKKKKSELSDEFGECLMEKERSNKTPRFLAYIIE